MGANLSPEFVETALGGLEEHEIDAWLLCQFSVHNSILQKKNSRMSTTLETC